MKTILTAILLAIVTVHGGAGDEFGGAVVVDDAMRVEYGPSDASCDPPLD